MAISRLSQGRRQLGRPLSLTLRLVVLVAIVAGLALSVGGLPLLVTTLRRLLGTMLL